MLHCFKKPYSVGIMYSPERIGFCKYSTRVCRDVSKTNLSGHKHLYSCVIPCLQKITHNSKLT